MSKKKNPIVRPVSDTAKPVFPPKKTPKQDIEWSRLTAWPIECLTKGALRKAIVAARWAGEWLGGSDEFDDRDPTIETYCELVVDQATRLKVINDVEWQLWVTTAEGVDPRQAAWSAAVRKARKERSRGD